MGIRFIRPISLASALLSVSLLLAQPPILTWHNDSARTGQNLQETILTPANVNSTTFGRLATLTVDGKVDAQPLYVPGLSIPNQGVHNVLYVATEHGSLYAFDADTFAQLLKVSLLAANENPATVSCTQVTPEIGITGTPAIDLQAGPHGMIFLVSQSQDTSGTFHHRLHALDLPTLTEQLGGPVNISATYPGSGAENTFNPAEHVARPALLISNGVVYTSWGSHCDGGSYAGWILSYSETTLAQVGVLNVVPNGSEGGIWSAGSGPAADANGNIYALIGNGTFDTTLNTSGFPSKGDYGNSLIKVSTSGALSVVDYFTMSNTVSESNGDTDFGSAGMMLLPPLDNGKGTGTNVSLAVGAGKDHNIYILDQSNLGKFNSNQDSIYQQLSGALPTGTWSSPAWFNGNLYYAGQGDNLRQFAFSAGAFSLSAKSSIAFPFPGSTPAISANGTTNGIVWALQNSNPAVLHAYSAASFPTELYNSSQAANNRDQFGAGNKYIVPTIVNGKVYVGTTTGVGVFGLFPAIGISKTHNGNFTQGQQGASYSLTVSNAAGVAPTSGIVTVTESVPTSLTLAGMSGTGWTCPSNGNTCTRSDALSANSSYPTITVTVNVASNAPASVTNVATVTGGGDTTTANKTANDVTTITAQTTILPATPVLSFPQNGSTGVSLKPSLSWGASSGATSYDVYFGTSATPPLVTNTTTTTYAPAVLTVNVTYHWQVVAKNSAGNTPSSIFSFTTFNPSCTFAVSPSAVLIAYTGGSASVAVTAGTGCAWTATSSAPWLTITTGTSGSGNGTISFAAASNASTAHLAYLTFANQTAGVMQGGAPSDQIFNDVPPTDPYFDYISAMAGFGITLGCQTSPPLYCTNSPVTRAEMAALLIRAYDVANGSTLTFPPTPYFQDVPASGVPDSIYYGDVQRLAQLGITLGCQSSPALFCPDQSVSQGQMAAFMIRSWMLLNNITTLTYSPTPHTDVPATDLYFSYVQKMFELGFWTGCGGGSYCENSAVSRDQMAPMIMRSMMGAP